MFQHNETQSGFISALRTFSLIFHATVRQVRMSHGNALVALLMNLLQTILFVGAFYVIFLLMGMQGSSLRGDFMLYILSGIFLFLTFTKTMSAVVGSEGPSSPMMKHRNMTTAVAISAAALSRLYIQTLSVILVLTVYHFGFERISIYDPVGALMVYMITWLNGIAVGMMFLAAKPWAPNAVSLVSSVYGRINIFASGKMFVANTLPGFMLVMFSWNPLFHCIDQMRGFVFINYYPRNTSLSYPLWVTLACLVIGLMGEFYTRKHASLSWFARR